MDQFNNDDTWVLVHVSEATESCLKTCRNTAHVVDTLNLYSLCWRCKIDNYLSVSHTCSLCLQSMGGKYLSSSAGITEDTSQCKCTGTLYHVQNMHVLCDLMVKCALNIWTNTVVFHDLFWYVLVLSISI